MPTISERLAALRELCDALPDPPWHFDGQNVVQVRLDGDPRVRCGLPNGDYYCLDNPTVCSIEMNPMTEIGDFIAASRTATPALIAALEDVLDFLVPAIHEGTGLTVTECHKLIGWIERRLEATDEQR